MKRLIFCGILILLLSGCAEPVMGWGLSFQTEGLPPAAPMTAEKLRELGGAYENGYTEEILDVLQELQVPAAFFLTGDYLSREPDLVRRMTAEGHIVGNHTMTHPDMTAVDAEKFRAELQGLEEKYFDITGQTLPKYYRPPQGVYDENTLKKARIPPPLWKS